MFIKFNEQDLTNACCVFAANQTGSDPEGFDITFHYEDKTGFEAKVEKRFFGRKIFSEDNIIEAITFYLCEDYNFESHQLSIKLTSDDEFGAEIIAE